MIKLTVDRNLSTLYSDTIDNSIPEIHKEYVYLKGCRFKSIILECLSFILDLFNSLDSKFFNLE